MVSRAHNSTIRLKEKTCLGCGRLKLIFSKGKCVDCARISRIFERDEKETIEQEDLSGLIEDADAVYSTHLRLSNSVDGECKCYTCGKKITVGQAQCGHYIYRKCYYLRWDSRNTRVQCEDCNVYNKGNLSVFARKLEDENEGITEILLEESRIVYKLGREELRIIISDCTEKINQLKIK